MKYKYFVLLFMFSIVSTFAQYNVNINVTDAATMLDIDTADVTFDGTTLQTDVNGDVTFTNFSDGMYNYTISKSCYQSITGSITVSGADVNENYALNAQTSASVFVTTSNHPIIGSWVDGSINLNDGVNNYDYDVTEFDNIVANVVFGTYNYTFTRPGACDTTGTITVDCSTIDPMSGNVFLPIFSEDATIDTSVTQNSEMLTANASGVDITYQWVDCDNSNAPIDGETNQIFTAVANGNYAVIVTNSDCPISDISVCYSVNTLSVETIENPISIKIYPNPVVNSINIALGNTYQDINVQIYSITGQLINNVNKTNSVKFDIDMSNLPSGNYILKINADGNIKSSLVIKK